MIDPAQDPDRYDAAKDVAPSGPLDPEQDPDRFRSPTLPGLLGEGAHEDKRDNLQWLIGLGCVFGFLLLVTLLSYLRG